MRFLFYVSKKYSIPIVQPIIKYLQQTDHSFQLFLSDKVKANIPEEWNSIPIIQENSQAILFDPDFVFVPGNFVDHRIPGIKVQLFHGLGVEKNSHFKLRHFFDIYCTSGPFVTDKFKNLKKKYGYFLVKETGWAKIDHIINFDTADLKKKIIFLKTGKLFCMHPRTVAKCNPQKAFYR